MMHPISTAPSKGGRPAGGTAGQPSGARRANGPSLLLVESDVLVRAALGDYFRGCGYRVTECSSALEALQVADSGTHIDLLFSEVELPGDMNGFVLAQRMRQTHPNVKIILAAGASNLAKASKQVCAGGPLGPKPQAHEALTAELRRLRARS